VKTVRVYKAEMIAVDNKHDITYQYCTIPLFDMDVPAIETESKTESKTYPIRQWTDWEKAQKEDETWFCLADDILERIFKDLEFNLQIERSAAHRVHRALEEYDSANFIQRLKYLFTKRLRGIR